MCVLSNLSASLRARVHVSLDRPRRPVESSSCCHGNKGGGEARKILDLLSLETEVLTEYRTHTHTHTQAKPLE